MPALPAWAVTAFWQYGVPLIIAGLRKAGFIGAAAAWEARLADRLVVIAKDTKTFSHNDQLNPKDSDFPPERGRDHLP